MYAIDTRFQLWLKECMLQTQQNRVDDSILNFTPLIRQVRFRTFKLKLPSAFSKPPKLQTKDTIATPKQKGKGKQKEDRDNRKRKKEREINTCIVNKHSINAFMPKDGKTWGGIFANKNFSGRIPWTGKCKNAPLLVHSLALLCQLRQCGEPQQSYRGASQQDIGLRQLHAGNP
jgi:hypothetical protein